MMAGASTGPGRPQQEPQTDWKWTIVRAGLMFVAVQAIMGQNGLIAQFTGKAGKDTAKPAEAPSFTSLASGDAPVTAAAPKAPLVDRNNLGSMALWAPDSPLDLYVFLTSAAPPTQEEISTQYSTTVPYGKDAGPSTDYVPFGAAQYDELLRRSPSFKAETKYVQAQGRTSDPLPAVRWSKVRLDNSSTINREVEFDISIPPSVQSENGSIWADIFLTLSGVSPDPAAESHDRQNVLHVRKLLTRIFPAKKARIERNLFEANGTQDATEDEADSEEKPGPPPLVTYWHRNMSLAILQQEAGGILPIANTPPPINQWINLERTGLKIPASSLSSTPSSAPSAAYYVANYPIVFPNDFWLLREHMYPINKTLDTLPIRIDLSTMSWFKFQLYAAMSDSFEKSARGQGLGGSMAAGEMDMVKRMLLETNPWFLGLTMVVSLLHALFEFLAFSADVTDWRKKKSMAGISVSAIFTNVFVQLIILLYLVDSQEETSWMILAGQGMGLVIEAWKLTKAMTVSFVRAQPDQVYNSRFSSALASATGYTILLTDRHTPSEEEKQTQEYDRIAFRLVAWITAPFLGCWTIYSAVYQTHKGWWSFCIGTLCSFVYAFSFATLIPQLIVNYKLKSTAGMNSKVFVFKILGTFVDDLFAFCIKMPTLHRLACFRDDVVFFIFLYQRYIYGVDPTRVNEYGQRLVDEDEVAKLKAKEASADPSASTGEKDASATATATGVKGSETAVRARNAKTST